MAILFECFQCKSRFSRKHTACPHCGRLVGRLVRSFFLELRDSTGKKIYKRLGNVSLDKAKQFEFEIKQKIANDKFFPDKKPLTWQFIAGNYLVKLEASGRGSRYIFDSRRFFKEMSEFWGSGRLAEQISESMINDFRLSLLKRGLSKASTDRYLALGRAAWNYSAIDFPNPFAKAKLLRPNNELIRFLTDEQRTKLLQAAKSLSKTLYEIIFVSLATGLRKSNVLRLRKSEVNFENRSISVTGKGGRTHTIFPTESVFELLEDIEPNETDFFWISKETGQPYHIDWRRLWIRAKNMAGIPKEFRWHDMRHDAGTRLYLQTGDIRLTQEALGHSDARMTMRYSHINSQHLRKGFDTIDPLKSSYTSSIPNNTNNTKDYV